MKSIFTLLSLCFSVALVAQSPTKPDVIKQSLEKKTQITNSSLVKNVAFTNIGPTVMSGRVVDIDVNPENPTEFYVGYASGGLFYTNNNGTTLTPILDNAATLNVGDIAVDWQTGTLWVGTGENNSSRSSYAGIGILKSTDKGQTWINVGLPDSHHIGRILINPNNADEVIIGAIGHLYSPNAERGIFKTTDGGKTWSKTLFINENTGVIDIAFAPENFNVMYAASWERERKAWDFDGDGENSAIYKSTDAGNTWTKIADKSGFPTGSGVGRIGLAVFNENTVYALHDSQYRRKPKDDKKVSYNLTKEQFNKLTSAEVLALRNETLNTYLKEYGFREKFRAEGVKQLLSPGGMKPKELMTFLDDEMAVAFEEPVIGAEVFKTTNGGKTWKKTHTNYLDGIYSSYGYYFGEIRVDLQDENGIYILGVGIIKSKDGGKTFTSISKENVHSDHQALWVNPKKSGHLVEGNDGGLNISYDDGENWIKLNNIPVGQFYSVNVDNEKNYNVYGGLQDNGVWFGPNNARVNKSWKQSGQNPFKSIMGGDGMQVQIDNRNSNIVYTGSQFGSYFRLDLESGSRKYIQPKPAKKAKPYRFNWQTPILLSPHNQDILYLGSNKLHRSLNKGDDWEEISDDLTQGGKKGNVAYGTLTTISESPFKFGLIYTGSDDGVISLTTNGGGSWTKVSNDFPQDLWVSRVIASKFKKERVYATLNGYRYDDFTPYVYMSDDFGKTWKNIGKSIPTSAVNVIKEDTENENILYVGTDNGLYISFDKGTSWQAFSKNLPNVAVHDLVIQPTAKDLIVGTHGRSLYKTNIAALQEITPEVLAKSIAIFKIEDIRQNRRWGVTRSPWRQASTPEVTIPFYTNANKKVTVNVFAGDVKINTMVVDADKGYNETIYDVSFSKSGLKAYQKENKKAKLKKSDNGFYYLPKGKYTVTIGDAKSTFEVK
ncbi:VPS10 domain-containing protein [Polaribacter sargassicola]|uniref:VPS10 domain-containing protein n=1 Tax=Polaribacter sargassicola TaxID=2836891 RepID=UPI001F15B700|nr:glycosyl hydrolase [Polaribacter sp. DS7-9]MCG1035018.1 glycosyl hydrolase [Polaribacter sp. DS7-9]